MDLKPNGIDILYVDESERYPLFATTVIRVPFLRPVDGGWRFVWEEYLNQAIEWRRHLSQEHNIRFREELHGYKILGHKGQYLKTWQNLSPPAATALYRDALSRLTFLPENSIMTTYATEYSELMGQKGIAACLGGLFQRIRKQCSDEDVNGILFFDTGHDEYVHHFRKATKYLPTGSSQGGWGPGERTRNLPLSMFPKDANIKHSHLSYFIQIADLIVYAARIKLEHETRALAAKRERWEHHAVYDALPEAQLNTRATRRRYDAIVPV